MMMDSDNDSMEEVDDTNNSKTKSKKTGAKPTKIAKTNNGDNDNDDSSPLPEGCIGKIKRMASNCFSSCGLCCFKFKEKSFISKYEFQITQRQKKFGVDYLELVHRKASQQALKQCLKLAMNDIAVFQKEIDDHDDKIDKKQEDVDREINASTSSGVPASPPKKKKSTKQEEPILLEEEEQQQQQQENVKSTKKKSTKKKQGQGQSSGEARPPESNRNLFNPPSGEMEEEMDVVPTKPKPNKPKKKKKPVAPPIQ
jgi:hypothetical protein